MKLRGLLVGLGLVIGFGGCAASGQGVPQATGLSRFVTATGRWGYLDSTGAVVLASQFRAAGPFADGWAAVRESGLYGYIDPAGRYQLPPVYDYATGFLAGRAVVWRGDTAQLIDRKGVVLTTRPYRRLGWLTDDAGRPMGLWASGVHNTGLLAPDGRVLADTLYDGVSYLGAGRFQLQTRARIRLRHAPDDPTDTTTFRVKAQYMRVVMDRTGRVLVPLKPYTEMGGGIQTADSSFRHGLLAVVLANRPAYVNRTGRVVWQQAPADARPPYNLDFMRTSDYKAPRRPLRMVDGYEVNRWAPKGAANAPVQLELCVEAAADVLDAARRPAHRLHIANIGSDTAWFEVQDQFLYLVVQAQNAAGQWQDVEKCYNSWCGNSYGNEYLSPGQGWQLAVPAYTGSQPTRLRVQLMPLPQLKGPPPGVWYSNEFSGSINPAQFWRQSDCQLPYEKRSPTLSEADCRWEE